MIKLVNLLSTITTAYLILFFVINIKTVDSNYLRKNARRMAETNCGNWQHNYTILHHQMRTGQIPPRWAVWSCTEQAICGGLGDRFVGIITAFLFAIFTNRAILVDWTYPCNATDALSYSNVNWVWDKNLPNSNYRDFTYFTHGPLTEQHPLFDGKTPEEVWGSYPSVIFTGNRGHVYSSYLLSQLKPYFEKIELRPEVAFGCLLNYLFSPSKDIQPEIQKYVDLIDRPDVFSIGIHVRHYFDSGFGHYSTHTVHNSRYDKFWNCAKELEKIYALKSQKIVWFFMSDSITLKESLTKPDSPFVNKILTTNVTPRHIDIGGDESPNKNISNFFCDLKNQVIENFIFSYVDKFIISESGYSKTAYYRSLKLRDAYLISNHYGLPELENCSYPEAYTPLSVLGKYWSTG